ncbi:hypothetical protein LCGC14_2403340 [marine sediment metagenome]|uniref:Uncharacterized protein n=1 Tax=marine sediment metagenome TaxID=412755 RepID=A0A0F9BUT4_9ZZZZ
MVVKNTRTKTRADMVARRARRIGLNASVFKKKRGYGVSVTRNK